jgi:hypothetical protein
MSLSYFLKFFFIGILFVSISNKTNVKINPHEETEYCNDPSCLPIDERLDREMVLSELAKGKTPEQVIDEQSEKGNYHARCPDTAILLDDIECKYLKDLDVLTRSGKAKVRFDAAIKNCIEHSLTVTNNCLIAMANLADKELVRALDSVKRRPSVRAYADFVETSWESCIKENPPTGGSGYSASISICHLEKIANKIDELS